MTQTTEPPDVESPARQDRFVAGLSEAIGGPAGEHVTTPYRRRFLAAAGAVLALVCLTLTLHWAQKSPCADGAWVKLNQYRQMCYTDVLALYGAEGLGDGQVPYRDHAVEYPVLTGVFIGLIGLPVHALGRNNPSINQYEWFYEINAFVLSAFAVASCAVILALRRRRPWDAAMFAASPALLLTATVNWDLLAVGLALFGVYAWSRNRPLVAGILLGLGTAAKLWPGFLFIPLTLLALRARRFREAFLAGMAGVLTWAALNLPVLYLYPASWKTFFRLNQTRAIDWGTLWYVGTHLPFVGGAVPGFHALAAHPSALSTLTYVIFGICCAGIAWMTFTAPRRPRLGQLAFLVVAAFLIFSKVWSQQYVLWLLPLAVLARPRWGAFLAWQAAEVCYFCAFYGELLAASGKPIFPETVFVLAAVLRLGTVVFLAGSVIHDIYRPERDAVRHTYPDDPDGGVLDGAPDAQWLERLAPTPA